MEPLSHLSDKKLNHGDGLVDGLMNQGSMAKF